LSSLNVRTTVVYRDGSSHISGDATGGATGSDRVHLFSKVHLQRIYKIPET